MYWLQQRIAIARQILDRRWVHWAIGIWAVVGFYDTALSQLVPETLANRFPKVHEVIAMTTGFLSFGTWSLILAAIIAGANIEYVVRKSRPANRAAPAVRPAEPYDEPVKWAIDHLQSLGMKPDDALDALRQAARNSTVTVYGRPNSGHQSPDNYYKPIEPIETDHWRNFGFDILKCIFHEDSRECRTEPDDRRSAAYDQVYVDLRVKAEEIKAKWPAPNSDKAEVGTTADPSRTEQRRLLIGQARKFVARTLKDHPSDQTYFIRQLQTDIAFLSLRPHLSEDFLKNISGGRMYLAIGNSPILAIARFYLDELERLEKKWGLL